MPSLLVNGVKSPPAMQETQIPSVGEEWQPTAAFLPGESYRQGSLADSSPWGCMGSGINERLTAPFFLPIYDSALVFLIDFHLFFSELIWERE